MAPDPGYTCSRCGGHHTELPMGYSTMAPDVWDASLESDPDSMLSTDQCIVRHEHYFIKGLIEVPVAGSREPFSWGVWVSLSRENFGRALDVWETPGRESEKPYFGWLTTELGLYSPRTTNLRTNAHTRPIGRRPLIELEPTDHPLAVEQRNGITFDRVREIAEAVQHAEDDRS
ncbi:DUF2199 domain-containing protein [Streptomyces sp. NPDC091387]